MGKFLDDDYFLTSETAKKLYHGYAEDAPIFDFHCHINPKEIAEDKKYGNITEIWLGGDHYKWRLMRANGVDEYYITGGASAFEKFQKWAETLPYCVSNPVYLWSHLELKRYFGVDELLNPESAKRIYDRCNGVISGGDFSTRKIIESSGVLGLCTTDNPVDSLEYHQKLRDDPSFKVKVLPAFRPDDFVNIGRPGFAGWVAKLEKAAGMKIGSLDNLRTAMEKRIAFFDENGCRLSDHALERAVYVPASDAAVGDVFEKAMNGAALTGEETDRYVTWALLFLGREYSKRGWIMQYHIGSVRNVNLKQMKLLGPDTGFDAACDFTFGPGLAKLLGVLDEAGALPRTILYSLSPNNLEMLASIGGCFSEAGVPGKMQLGSAWWYNDQKDGIRRQLTALANLGLLSRFVGMVTDSRSFLSYTRHEYFRRVLCGLLGEWADSGEVPSDLETLGVMVRDICCDNAMRYFGLQR